MIDYKTGRQIKQTDLNIRQHEDIFKEKKYSNIFQLLFYCLAIEKDKEYVSPVESGIISFRNINAGELKTKFIDKSNLVTQEKIEDYKKGLEKLITEILEVNIPFIEKDLDS